MLLQPAAAAPAAADDRHDSAAAPAAGSACPRLTWRATLEDPILDDRSDDLTVIDRGTGERHEAIA